MSRTSRLTWTCLLLGLLPAGCVGGGLGDEMAETMEATRPDNVRAMKAVADAAERLPATLDGVNELLRGGAESSARLRDAEQGLVEGVGRITSGTASAVERLAGLTATLEEASRSARGILRDAELIAAETREDRRQIVASVAAITSSAQLLMSRWERQSAQREEEEDRAVRALADLSDSLAKTARETAAMTESASRVGRQVEPDLVSTSRSVAHILEDVAKITRTLSSEQAATGSLLANALGGFLGVLAVAGLVFGVRAAFRRAVARAAREMARAPEPPVQG